MTGLLDIWPSWASLDPLTIVTDVLAAAFLGFVVGAVGVGLTAPFRR